MLAEFDALCPPRTIFATNTSTLLPSQFARASARPDRLVALHFHIPVWVTNLSHVMPHEGTRPEVVTRMVTFAREIGQVPIELRREHSGYIFNAMFTAVNREAITMAEQGVAPIEDIDRAWMHVTKWPHGHSVVWTPSGSMSRGRSPIIGHGRSHSDAQLRRNATFLKRDADRGELGVKSGKGFYSYPDPAFARPGFIDGQVERTDPA